MLPKNISVSRRSAAQAALEIREHAAVGDLVRDIAQVEPLPREVPDQCLRADIRQHPPHLLLEDRRILELPFHGEVQELVVGNAAPEEEREPRRQLHVADAINGVRGDVRRVVRGPTGNAGLTRSSAARLDAGPVAGARASLVVSHQRLKVFFGDNRR
jgi:hypothetical protein